MRKLSLIITLVLLATTVAFGQSNMGGGGSGGGVTLVTTNPTTFSSGQTFYNTVTNQFSCATSSTTLITPCGVSGPGNHFYISANCGSLAGAAQCFQVHADGRLAGDASVTNTQPQITSATMNFQCPASVYPCSTAGVAGTDVGKHLWVVGGTASSNNGARRMTGTIISIQSSTQATLNANANITEANDFVAACTDDTTTLQAAWAAMLTAGAVLYIDSGNATQFQSLGGGLFNGSGYICFSALPFGVTNANNFPFTQDYVIHGQSGTSASFLMMDTYTFAANALFYAVNGLGGFGGTANMPKGGLRDIQIEGLEYGFAGQGAGQFLIANPQYIDNVNIRGFGGVNTNVAFGMISSGQEVSYLRTNLQPMSTSVDALGVGSGSNKMFTDYGNIYGNNGAGSTLHINNGVDDKFFGDLIFGAQNSNANPVINITASVANFYGMDIFALGLNPSIGIQVDGTSTASFHGSHISAQANGTTALKVLAGGVVYLDSVDFSKSTTGSNIAFNNAGTLYMKNAVCNNLAPSINSGIIVDQGGNGTCLTPAQLTTNTGSIIADGHSVTGVCTGAATASTTLGLYGTGPNATTTTCTSATIGTGIVAHGSRTAANLVCTATSSGTTTGACTVVINGGASIITCNLTTGLTYCSDATHTVALNDGDRVSIEFIAGAATTQTGIQATVEWF